MSEPGVSAGDIGGVFAGLVALLAVLGKGTAWILNWKDARATTRSAKLDAWQRELDAREAKIDAEVDGRLAKLEGLYDALSKQHTDVLIQLDRARSAYRVIAAELVSIAPHSAALIQATAILNEPLPALPDPEQIKSIGKLNNVPGREATT